MGGRSGQSINRASNSLSQAEKNFLFEMENNPNGVSFQTLSRLRDYDIDAFNVYNKISTNYLESSNTYTEAEKKAFDRLRTKKDYLLYRGDKRYNTENTKKGDVLDFEKKATFTSSDINQGIVAGSRSIIVFEKGTKSMKRAFDNAEFSELVRGKFRVTRVEGNKIFVKQI